MNESETGPHFGNRMANRKRQSESLSASGYVLIVLVIIGWGTSWPFLKIALSEIPPWTFRA